MNLFDRIKRAFMGEVKISGVKFNNVNNFDIVGGNFYVNGEKVTVEHKSNHVTVEISGDMTINKLDCNVLNVHDGNLSIKGKLECNNVEVGKNMDCYDVEANNVEVNGDLTCESIDAMNVKATRMKK